jgi:hypothetical protein
VSTKVFRERAQNLETFSRLRFALLQRAQHSVGSGRENFILLVFCCKQAEQLADLVLGLAGRYQGGKETAFFVENVGAEITPQKLADPFNRCKVYDPVADRFEELRELSLLIVFGEKKLERVIDERRRRRAQARGFRAF